MKNIFDSLVKKKQKLDRLLPLRNEVLVELENWLRVELTYSSNAIEGNTLTRKETAEILEKASPRSYLANRFEIKLKPSTMPKP